MKQQQQQPSVFRAKQEYRKATLRIYGTVGELTKTIAGGTSHNDNNAPSKTHA
jgi:hypothetical protein